MAPRYRRLQAGGIAKGKYLVRWNPGRFGNYLRRECGSRSRSGAAVIVNTANGQNSG